MQNFFNIKAGGTYSNNIALNKFLLYMRVTTCILDYFLHTHLFQLKQKRNYYAQTAPDWLWQHKE
jgi:hypothetical protein